MTVLLHGKCVENRQVSKIGKFDILQILLVNKIFVRFDLRPSLCKIFDTLTYMLRNTSKTVYRHEFG